MQPDPKDAAYLYDVLSAARSILAYTKGATFDQFQKDSMMRHACERQLEIIGEAARRVSDGFRDAHREIPWRRMIAQRNVLAHEYGEIKLELIWKLISAHVPELIAGMGPLVPTPPPDPEPEP